MASVILCSCEAFADARRGGFLSIDATRVRLADLEQRLGGAGGYTRQYGPEIAFCPFCGTNLLRTDALEPGRSLLHLRLLYEGTRAVDTAALQRALDKRLPGAKVTRHDRGVVQIAGPAQLEIDGRSVPASLAITTSAIAPYAANDYLQSWQWGARAAAEAGGRAGYAVSLGEQTSMMLATPARVQMLLQATASLVETHPPIGIHWPRLERFDEPARFLESLDEPDALRSVINVRLFKVNDALVMDTLGLCFLGMLDLQVHFRDLDLETVGHYLYDLAVSHVQRGPAAHVATASVIDDGESIDGPDGKPATCRFEMAMMPPRRGVIDIEPSAQFAVRS